MAVVELFEAAALHVPEPLATAGFVVSIHRRGKHRKPHLLEGCRYRPGVDYRDSCAYGVIMPSGYGFESVCEIGFPAGPPPGMDPGGSGSSSSSFV